MLTFIVRKKEKMIEKSEQVFFSFPSANTGLPLPLVDTDRPWFFPCPLSCKFVIVITTIIIIVVNDIVILMFSPGTKHHVEQRTWVQEVLWLLEEPLLAVTGSWSFIAFTIYCQHKSLPSSTIAITNHCHHHPYPSSSIVVLGGASFGC